MIINAPDKAQYPALKKLWQEAFGDTEEFLDTFWRTAFSPDRCRCVTINGQVAAALYWFDCSYKQISSDTAEPVAYIYAVATTKAYQGQGICHKLMLDTHRLLAGLGYAGAILVPGSKELFRLYEGMGYDTCSYINELHCSAKEASDDFFTKTPASGMFHAASVQNELRPIDMAEYAVIRRRLLPERGIIQENENLHFLNTHASFYAGADYLLACSGDGDTLQGIELLGNTASAANIIRVLGYTRGIFRTPGNDIPFAMYYPLKHNKQLQPAYFGLAFD